MTKKIMLLMVILIGIVFFNSCEKDDICLESEAKTSRLIIRFKDNADHSLFKTANLLAVQGIGNDNIINFGSRDSIAIPLNTATDISQFKFMKDYEQATENMDQLNFNYTRTDEFVSRACGYRTIFESLTTSIVNDTNNWILDYEITNTTINNEDEKQLIIYH
jgi:hypothetical protein